MFCCLGGYGGRRFLKGTRGFQGGAEGEPIAANRTLRKDYRKLTANQLPIRGGGEGEEEGGGGVMRIFLGSGYFFFLTRPKFSNPLLPPPT